MFAFCPQTMHRHILRSQEGFTAPVRTAGQVQASIPSKSLQSTPPSLQATPPFSPATFLENLSTSLLQKIKSLPLPKLRDAAFSQVQKSYMPNSPQLV